MTARREVFTFCVRVSTAHGSRSSVKKEIDFAIARLKFDAWSVAHLEEGEPVRAPARKKGRR